MSAGASPPRRRRRADAGAAPQAPKPRRLASREERERAEQRRERNGRLIASFLVASTAAILFYVFTASSGPGAPSAKALEQLRVAAAAAHCTVTAFPTEGRTHTDDKVVYKTNPPTSGAHNPT